MSERERLRVSATTRPQKLGGAIAKAIVDEKKKIEIVAVGAGALNQLVKGLIMARRFVSSSGIDLAFKPAFETLTLRLDDGTEKEVTAIKCIPIEL